MRIDAIDLGKKVPCKILLKALEEAATKENGQFISNVYDAEGGEKFLVLNFSSSGSFREEKRNAITVAQPLVKIPFSQYRDLYFQSEYVCIRFSVKESYFLKQDRYPRWDLILGNKYSELKIEVWIEGKKTSFAKKIRIPLMCTPIIGWIIYLIIDTSPINDGTIFSKERYLYSFPPGKQNELENQIEQILKRYFNSVSELLKNESSSK